MDTWAMAFSTPTSTHIETNAKREFLRDSNDLFDAEKMQPRKERTSCLSKAKLDYKQTNKKKSQCVKPCPLDRC